MRRPVNWTTADSPSWSLAPAGRSDPHARRPGPHKAAPHTCHSAAYGIGSPPGESPKGRLRLGGNPSNKVPYEMDWEKRKEARPKTGQDAFFVSRINDTGAVAFGVVTHEFVCLTEINVS